MMLRTFLVLSFAIAMLAAAKPA
ncbi:MAG: hypothetical protein QOE14_429, partial [Humisphaera sp.]|nr:hypothetical protein [Humisphaera sp.]